MRSLLQFIGTIVFFSAWPAFWVYFKLDRGRTRVVLINDDKVLVMKQWISPGKWNLPGGGIQAGESAVEGAVRELYEETSLKLDPRQLQSVGRATYRQYGLSFGYHVFWAKVATSNVRAQRIEVSDLEWRCPGDLTLKNASPDTLHSLEMVSSRAALLK
jgi:8-oxo-dGTP pyrophosphatase MutT (NUDIX family)